MTLLRAVATAQHTCLLLLPFYCAQVEPNTEPPSPSSWGQPKLPSLAQDTPGGEVAKEISL